MTILITLTTVGIDCSTFDIYSNVDGFLSAFETDVPKASLSAGFSSANVPDGTTIIRVKAKGVCTNYIDITLSTITTTTTTSSTSTTTTTTTIIPTIACSEYTSSGGQGVSEFNITLDNPLGGYIVVEFNAKSVPDKLEIIHNGVKKATSGMTTPNNGPFDDLYGNPTIPTNSEATATDQFIGSSKGTIPSRQSEFASETGSSLIMDSSYQQLIWWVYSASDFSIGNQVIIRITGPSGTVWEVKRLCETTPPISTTTTTTTSSSSTTTSTTTVAPTNCISYTMTADPSTIPGDLYVRYRHCTTDSIVDKLIQREVLATDNLDGTYTYYICVKQNGTYSSPVFVQNNMGVAHSYVWTINSDCSPVI